MNPTPHNYQHKSIDLMQDTTPSLITPSPTPTIELRRIKISKTDLENYQFCRNSGNDANGRG